MTDLGAYLAGLDERLLNSSDGRRALTRLDPLAFALTYLPHHLRGDETGDRITLSDFHWDLVSHARQGIQSSVRPAQHRDAYVAPRGCGKSTWNFLLIPMWEAAHGHRNFISAFADSGSQAEQHLMTFKRELDTNELLRFDYPQLCSPARRPGGKAVSDNLNMYVAESGFVFGAKGIDASSLGMKVGKRRPDKIVFDDIEPDESNYSAAQKVKRLVTLQDSVLPLNVYARVVLVGTVTMAGSIVHDLVKSVTLTEPPEPWVMETGFTTHYYPAIVTDETTGDERSIWPAKWPLDWLQSIRDTRDFKKNYANDPMGADGEYWTPEDFTYGTVPALTRSILSIDPAITSTERSDYTALAVVSFSASEGKCLVRDAWQLRIQPGAPLRDRVVRILDAYPEITGVLVETNQGGDAWKAILHDLPVQIVTVHQKEPKPVRAARLLSHYQRHRVLHEKRIRALEEQMVGFPKTAHDDLIDAVGQGVAVFLKTKPKAGPPRIGSYL